METDLDDPPLTKKRPIVECNGGIFTNGSLLSKENQVSLMNDLNSAQKLVNNNFPEKSRDIVLESDTDLDLKRNGKAVADEKNEDESINSVNNIALKGDISPKSLGPARPVSPDSLLMPPPPAPPPIRKTPTRVNFMKKPDKVRCNFLKHIKFENYSPNNFFPIYSYLCDLGGSISF